MVRQTLLYVMGEGGSQSLGEFHEDISHETVADNNVDPAGEEVHTFHVADEVEVAFLK